MLTDICMSVTCVFSYVQGRSLGRGNPAYPCRVILVSDRGQCSCHIPSGTGAPDTEAPDTGACRRPRWQAIIPPLTPGYPGTDCEAEAWAGPVLSLTSGVLWSRDRGQDMGEPRPVHYAETIMTCRRACLQCRYGGVTVAIGGVFW